MHTYISFLRGVNMTGHNSIRMADLSLLYESLGFKENKTFIQSGNVIFKTDKQIAEKKIAEVIENGINEKYGYNVPAMIRSTNELRALFLSNPYLEIPGFDPSKMAVIFLHEIITSDQEGKMRNINYPPDKYQLSEKEIFIYCPNGFGRTKLYTNFFEAKMGVTGTARNWKTVTAILKLAEAF
jgi:uncharacterized protein (DUF1697 family)